MPTCKECLHYEVCVYWCDSVQEIYKPKTYIPFDDNNDDYCQFFKNKADYAPVVRCKDCAYFYVEKQDEDFPYFCLHHSGPMRTAPNHFCNYGERKESEVQGE